MDDSLFIESDAGRSKSKRPKQKNDCTVRAIVETTGLDYDVVYAFLKEAGRQCSTGFDLKTWAKSNDIHGYTLKWEIRGQRRMNPIRFCRTFSTGSYIVRTAKHVFAIVDGKMHDTFRERDDRCIYGCWEVIKK